jgi:hypothetical protein
MVQLAGQNPMAASVAREKNDVTPAKFAGEQIVGSFAERRFHFHPFLMAEACDVVKSGAANNADFMFRHAEIMAFLRDASPVFSRLAQIRLFASLAAWNCFKKFSRSLLTAARRTFT